MKKLIIVILTLIANLSYAQTEIEDLKVVFNRFQDLIEKKEYNEAFDYYYSGFLELVPKSELLKDLENLNSNENYKYSIKDSKIISVSKIISKANNQYVIFKYRGKTSIKFNENSDKEMIEIIKQNVQNIYGEEYYYSEMNKEITFHKYQEMIGVKENGWKFFPYSKNLEPVIRTLFSQEILNEILSDRN